MPEKLQPNFAREIKSPETKMGWVRALLNNIISKLKPTEEERKTPEKKVLTREEIAEKISELGKIVEQAISHKDIGDQTKEDYRQLVRDLLELNSTGKKPAVVHTEPNNPNITGIIMTDEIRKMAVRDFSEALDFFQHHLKALLRVQAEVSASASQLKKPAPSQDQTIAFDEEIKK
ncbi:MAG: hypothetical protein PHD72_02590 [Patescibacteria group bacterium]|nr:hypothetical protein [Patescibacteria group bacterium]